MKTIGRLLFALWALSATILFAEEWTRKSPRSAKANIIEDAETFVVSVSFRPVTSFDDGKNLLENEKMSRSVAEWGLLQEFGATPDQVLEVSGLQRTAFDVSEDQVTATFRIPVGGIRLVRRKVEPVAQPEEKPQEELPPWPESVSDPKVVPEFEAFFRNNPFLMETGGAKIVRFADGTTLVVSVGLVDAAKSPMSRITVGKTKAVSALTAAIHGTQVYTTTSYYNRSVVITTEESETGADVEDSMERIRTQFSGWLPGLPFIGSWLLKDQGVFCYAIGGFLPDDAKDILWNKD